MLPEDVQVQRLSSLPPSEITAAWNALGRAMAALERPLLDARWAELESWNRFAPPAVTSAAPKIQLWLQTLDMLLTHLAADLDVPVDAPPSRAASHLEIGLRTAIAADPADDDLRRHFADLASGRGDPKGELVRVQLDALATTSPARSTFLKRARELVESHPEWLTPLTALGATEVEFDRGFPADVTMPIDAFFANAAALVAATPLTTLRLRGALAGRGAELAARSELAHVTKLDLRETGATDADLAALAGSPHLTRLRELLLQDNKVTDAGVDALAGSATLPALARVALQFNPARNPVDELTYYDETSTHLVPTAAGQALEAKYGRLRWLHPD